MDIRVMIFFYLQMPDVESDELLHVNNENQFLFWLTLQKPRAPMLQKNLMIG